MKDSRECSRCGRLNETDHAIDPEHTCPHGKPCDATLHKRCAECYLADFDRRLKDIADRYGPQAAEIAANVRAGAIETARQPGTLAALGGRAVSGVADGPAAVQRRRA